MTRLKSNFEHNDMDASNVDTADETNMSRPRSLRGTQVGRQRIAGEPRQLLDLLSPNKSDRLSSEDYLENDTSENVGPSDIGRRPDIAGT
jgi:hypothetical protein